MASGAKTDWNTGDRSGTISIGTHSLYASIAGPPRQPNQPVVVIMHGMSSAMTEWPVAFRLISQKYRVLNYNRSGLGQSAVGPNEPSPENVAMELGALLRAASIEPPYVTVAHSWGGNTSLEFLASRKSGEVAGMVFVDANSPHYFDVMPKLWQEECVVAVSKDLDLIEAFEMQKETVLSPQEWEAFVAEDGSEKHSKQGEREMRGAEEGMKQLAAKQLLQRTPPVLGTAPVVVLRGGTELDQEKVYKAGVAKGNGTEQQRREFRAILDGWVEKDVRVQKGFFGLTSGQTKFIQAANSGHNVQMTEPGLIYDAVGWIMENI